MGNSAEFCFPDTLFFSRGEAEGNIEVKGKQNSLFCCKLRILLYLSTEFKTENIYLTVFPKRCLQLTLSMSHWPGEIWPPPWLEEYPRRKHVTGTSLAGLHVNTEHSRKFKELNKHSQ